MDKELLDKIKSLKVDAPVKKKRCTECKKKKQPVTKLPEVIEEEEIYVPTQDDIMLAYLELGNRDNRKHPFINKVYRALFNQDFNFGCASCVNVQVRVFKNYIETTFNVKL